MMQPVFVANEEGAAPRRHSVVYPINAPPCSLSFLSWQVWLADGNATSQQPRLSQSFDADTVLFLPFGHKEMFQSLFMICFCSSVEALL